MTVSEIPKQDLPPDLPAWWNADISIAAFALQTLKDVLEFSQVQQDVLGIHIVCIQLQDYLDEPFAWDNEPQVVGAADAFRRLGNMLPTLWA